MNTKLKTYLRAPLTGAQALPVLNKGQQTHLPICKRVYLQTRAWASVENAASQTSLNADLTSKEK